MSALFSTSAMTGTQYWRRSRDGDPVGLTLYRRHYSRRRYADGRDPALFVGPGEKLVLLAHDDDALFVWRKFIDASGQHGINCAVFRNESEHVASAMILDAERWAWDRWPGERLYTYVNPSRIRSVNPGYCFKRAGWRTCGQTKAPRPLVVLEKWATSPFRTEDERSLNVVGAVAQDRFPRSDLADSEFTDQRVHEGVVAHGYLAGVVPGVDSDDLDLESAIQRVHLDVSHLGTLSAAVVA